SAPSSSVRTKTRATRRSGVILTAVTVTRRRRGSFASRMTSRASSLCTRCPTRSGRRSAMRRSRVVQELDPLLGELRDLELPDEADDLPQAAVDVRFVRTDLADAEERALPEVVVLALGDRDVELVLHARLDGAQHAALALQRMVLGQEQRQTEHADHHGPVRRLRRALRRLRRLRRGRAQPAGDLLDLERLDHVADLL